MLSNEYLLTGTRSSSSAVVRSSEQGLMNMQAAAEEVVKHVSSRLILLGFVLLSRQAGRSDVPILLLKPVSKPRQGVLMLLHYTLQLMLPLSVTAHQVCLSLWQGRHKLFTSSR